MCELPNGNLVTLDNAGTVRVWQVSSNEIYKAAQTWKQMVGVDQKALSVIYETTDQVQVNLDDSYHTSIHPPLSSRQPMMTRWRMSQKGMVVEMVVEMVKDLAMVQVLVLVGLVDLGLVAQEVLAEVAVELEAI